MDFFLLCIALRQAFSDITSRKIRNIDSAILLAIFLLYQHWNYLLGFSIFCTLSLFYLYFHGVGAGDIKLISILGGATLTFSGFLEFTENLTLISGVGALLLFIRRKSLKISLPWAPYIWFAYLFFRGN